MSCGWAGGGRSWSSVPPCAPPGTRPGPGLSPPAQPPRAWLRAGAPPPHPPPRARKSPRRCGVAAGSPGLAPQQRPHCAVSAWQFPTKLWEVKPAALRQRVGTGGPHPAPSGAAGDGRSPPGGASCRSRAALRLHGCAPAARFVPGKPFACVCCKRRGDRCKREMGDFRKKLERC